MSELPRCKLCGGQATIKNSAVLQVQVTCSSVGCPVRCMPWVSIDAWIKLMSDTEPDWARVRETAKEPIPLRTWVIAFSAEEKKWWSNLFNFVDPKLWTHWHYPAPDPIQKKPSKFEKWLASLPIDSAIFVSRDNAKASWNSICEALGKPEEKVQ